MLAVQRTQDFVEGAARETDLHALSGEFSKAIEAFGFERFACVSTVDPEKLPPGTVAVVDYPEDWASYYISQSLHKTDPTLLMAHQRATPFRWSNLSELMRLSPRQKRVLEEAADFGFREGVTVGIREPMSFPATVNMVGRDVDANDQVVGALHLMAVYMHGAAKRITRASIRNQLPMLKPLSPREIDCMRWVAAGKSDWEIGEILSISEHTVHGYIEQAKKKFGVATRQQAVVEGMLAGDIVF